MSTHFTSGVTNVSASGSGVYWEILTCSGMLNRKKVMQDKIAWIKKHIQPMPVVTGTLKGKHKAAYAAPGHVLIDDRQENIYCLGS